MTVLEIPVTLATKTVRLISRRWFVSYYVARCLIDQKEFAFITHQNEGCADYVDVYCGLCGSKLGRVREDYGGDFYLTEKEFYTDANAGN